MLPKFVEKLIMTVCGGRVEEKFVKVCEGFHSGVERRVVITKREVKVVWC